MAAELALESVDEVTEGRGRVLDQQSDNDLAETGYKRTTEAGAICMKDPARR